jgi:hypothetical protein
MPEDNSSRTLGNLAILCWKNREKIKLLEKRVDTLYVIVWAMVIYELCKILF